MNTNLIIYILQVCGRKAGLYVKADLALRRVADNILISLVEDNRKYWVELMNADGFNTLGGKFLDC